VVALLRRLFEGCVEDGGETLAGLGMFKLRVGPAAREPVHVFRVTEGDFRGARISDLVDLGPEPLYGIQSPVVVPR
jgi:hypothetical protein